MESPPGPRIVIDGREYLYFGGTSYHCLHGDASAMEAGIEAWRRFGTNTATSRRNLGTSPVHWQLEREAARFFGTDDAAYLASGYLVNHAALDALVAMEHPDRIYIDEHAHFSLWSAARATGLTVHAFEHRNPSALVAVISATLKKGQRPLIVSDGVFPGTGAIAPLAPYSEIIDEHGGAVWIDDSHGIGVLGAGGLGTLAELGIDCEQVRFGGTLSKAFGGFGGLIPGCGDFIDSIHGGPTMIGASPVPTPVAAATLQGIARVRAQPTLCNSLRNNALYLKQRLRDAGIAIDVTPTPIATFVVGDGPRMQRIRTDLLSRHIAVQYADGKYPGIGHEGALRVVVFSGHSRDHLDELVDALLDAARSV